MININIINECTNKKLPFPDVIRQLSKIGIDRYYVDLIRMEKTYYSHNGQSYVESLVINNLPKLGDYFNKEKVVESICASQKNEIDYFTFIRNIIAAGTVSYTVYLDGHQVIYTGRKGEAHTEPFHFKMEMDNN